MSIPVALEGLRAALAERGESGYLLTVSDDGRPHAVHVPLRWEQDELTTEVGKRTAANAAARPNVSLLCPVRLDGDYSLIIDGTAVVDTRADELRLRIRPTRAVLHRAAVVPDAASNCAADFVPLMPAAGRRS